MGSGAATTGGGYDEASERNFGDRGGSLSDLYGADCRRHRDPSRGLNRSRSCACTRKLEREELRSFSKGVDPRNFSMRTEGAIGNHDEDPRRAGCKNVGMHD